MPDLPTCHTPFDGFNHGDPVRCPNCQGQHYHDVPKQIADAVQFLIESDSMNACTVGTFKQALRRETRTEWRARWSGDMYAFALLRVLAEALDLSAADDLIHADDHLRFCNGDDDRPLVWCPTCVDNFYPVDGAPTGYNAGKLSNGYTVCPRGHVCQEAPFQNHPVTTEK